MSKNKAKRKVRQEVKKAYAGLSVKDKKKLKEARQKVKVPHGQKPKPRPSVKAWIKESQNLLDKK